MEDLLAVETSTIPTTNGDKPLPKQGGSRGLLPSTWLGRPVRLAYTDVYGSGQETSGTLLDWCGTGPVFQLAGAKTVINWDRIGLVELVND